MGKLGDGAERLYLWEEFEEKRVKVRTARRRTTTKGKVECDHQVRNSASWETLIDEIRVRERERKRDE
ncbi:hypothetical protein VNO77_33486 [Canavalia gladiata]|uniref:Uncharacterized protein n=1 Tax=Canavalia gladiata TaxID=3824 RepID=A0AAN9KDE6_CANGL